MRVTVLDRRGALPVLEGLAVITGKQRLERLVREMSGWQETRSSSWVRLGDPACCPAQMCALDHQEKQRQAVVGLQSPQQLPHGRGGRGSDGPRCPWVPAQSWPWDNTAIQQRPVTLLEEGHSCLWHFSTFNSISSAPGCFSRLELWPCCCDPWPMWCGRCTWLAVSRLGPAQPGLCHTWHWHCGSCCCQLQSQRSTWRLLTSFLLPKY